MRGRGRQSPVLCSSGETSRRVTVLKCGVQPPVVDIFDAIANRLPYNLRVPTSGATPAKSRPSSLRRYVSGGILAILVGALLLMFHKPASVAPPMKRADVAANAESFQQ